MSALFGVLNRLRLHCCWLVAKGEFGYRFHHHFSVVHTTPKNESLFHTQTTDELLNVFMKLSLCVAVIFLPLLTSHIIPWWMPKRISVLWSGTEDTQNFLYFLWWKSLDLKFNLQHFKTLKLYSVLHSKKLNQCFNSFSSLNQVNFI